jgi:hypothetical protein
MASTCKGDCKVTKKHQSTIQMHRTCTQHHPKHINKQKMFNKYLDMCKKAETGQEKTRKTSEKQRKTSSRESIKNDHESFLLIVKQSKHMLTYTYTCIASQNSYQIAQTPTASIKQHTQKWPKW